MCIRDRYLGCNMDSKTPAEWDITPYLTEGENTLALEVYRWSAGAYFECQDFWRLSGIERDVYLYSTPQTYISDYTVHSPLDSTFTKGLFNVDIDIDNLPVAPKAKKKTKQTPYTIKYRLLDAANQQVAQGSSNAAAQVSLGTELPDVHSWNAEHPYLYTPVSYTHLDVYKRQSRYRSRAGYA